MPDIPVVVTQDGAQPTPPKQLLAKLITNVQAEVPGYTANLPPALITDLASTATGAVALIDQAMVDTINSVTPYGANVPMLDQLGNIYGVPQGVGYNTSVNVVFMGPPGFVVPKGFAVSDGNHQYTVQNNAIIPSSGQSEPVFCVSPESGSWAIPAGTVKQIITSVPASMTLTCSNPVAGFPGGEDQPEWSYRAQVMQSGMFAVQGTPDCLGAALKKVTGVKPNLVAFRQVSLGKWVVIVGGGDPYLVGGAIYQSVPDISVLTVDVKDQNGKTPTSVTVTINDYPDSYDVPFVVPSSQSVSVILTWNTIAENFVDPGNISTAATPFIVEYINSIPVGQPVNIYQIQTIFAASVASIINPSQISLIEVQIAIDGTVVPPEPETDLVYGGGFSYFTTDSTHVTVQQYGSIS
ncbi:hypothetical protein [Citrobacter werkmanii]|uniref:hypothetical protein n=1 Tax=Citrobacter werkmanii TaxID=67827 RepID=UPI00300D5189